MIIKPNKTEYNSFFDGYVQCVGDNDVLRVLESQCEHFSEVFLPFEGNGHFAYAADKWTILQVARHIVDVERIFGFRLLSIVRGEQQCLFGFNENEYNLKAMDDDIKVLIQEFEYLRMANLLLIKGLNSSELISKGNVNGTSTSARAQVYIIAGHVLHHLNIIQERYKRQSN
ncbi:DinB family protein [Reichenbachiella versicolor]|uniref:DinB family protein n=1 Tax=Reichenbachiella versicolor TaxID=1821036 RepID=UPI000D6DFB3A|nr:DinB family protein [Reichenbachiella versicolor]